MLLSTEGIYRQGNVMRPEVPTDFRDHTPAIVTFLEPSRIDLPSRGNDETRAAEPRARMESLAQETTKLRTEPGHATNAGSTIQWHCGRCSM